MSVRTRRISLQNHFSYHLRRMHHRVLNMTSHLSKNRVQITVVILTLQHVVAELDIQPQSLAIPSAFLYNKYNCFVSLVGNITIGLLILHNISKCLSVSWVNSNSEDFQLIRNCDGFDVYFCCSSVWLGRDSHGAGVHKQYHVVTGTVNHWYSNPAWRTSLHLTF